MSVNGDGNGTESVRDFQGETAGIQPADSSAIRGIRPGAGAERSVASTAPRPAQAPATSITGASTSQEEEKRGGGGLDWLEVSCQGEWDRDQFEDLVERLERAKLQAQADGPGGFIEHPDGGKVIVRPAGFRVGTVLAEWCLEFDGITIGLANAAVPRDDRSNVFVTLHSMLLMQLGHVECWAQAIRLLSGLGYRIGKAVPSRFDACVDMVGHDMAEYGHRYQEGAYICRARKDKAHRADKRITGLDFGRGLFGRVYDKLLECREQPAKWAVLVASRYGGIVPDKAVRVEFQVRRDEMREMWSVTTVADLFEKLPAIVGELCTDWLRFTEEPVDRAGNHQSRADVWSRWLEVQAMFRQAFGPCEAEAPRQESARPDVTRLMLQAFGCVKSAAAMLNFLPKDAGELFAWMEGQFYRVMGADWWLALQRRADVLRARQPVNVESETEWLQRRYATLRAEVSERRDRPERPSDQDARRMQQW